MIFGYAFVFLIYILSSVSTGTVPPKHEKICQKLNVVLFFANSTSHLPNDPAGMKALEMHEVTKVKPNFPKHQNAEEHCDVTPPSCKDLLRDSLTSLVHFCQNALGMKTAIISVSHSEITNDIMNAEPNIPPEVRERHNPPFDIFQPGSDAGESPSMVQQQLLRRPEAVNLRDVITSPEHTEVFKIRVKRQLPGMEDKPPGEIVDVPLDKENKKPAWDVLDIMSHIRFSFFGKLFEDESKKKLNEEGNKISEDLTENKMDHGLFETVKVTLSTLQENSEQPLFMTVFGGHLSEVSECDSPLTQSIKHVIENTDPKDTLIVLTGFCPDEEHDHHHEYHDLGKANGLRHVPQQGYEFSNGREHDLGLVQRILRGYQHEPRRQRKRQNGHEENVVHIDGSGNGGHHENATIPVFARGPESHKLSQCSILFDVPVVVKSILEEISPTFEGQHRMKRSIFGDIRMNKENYKSFADRADRYYSVIFNLCIFILLVL